MVPLEETVRSIFGAWRLALLDRRGIALFNGTREGAVNSFWVAALLLPFHVILLAQNWAQVEADLSLGRLLLVESLAYVIGWTAFPVLAIPIVRMMGRWDRLFGFIAAYNWSHVIQMAVTMAAMIVDVSGILPRQAVIALLFAAELLMLIYEGWVIKLALSIGGLEAAGLVLLDVMLAVLVRGSAHDLIVG
jgi:hypothetical protein